MTPSKAILEDKAKHFANTVFFIGAGVLMLAASLLQNTAENLLGEGIGGNAMFIGATIAIFVLSSKRPAFALFAIERQCKKYGHLYLEESSMCGRCFKKMDKPADF